MWPKVASAAQVLRTHSLQLARRLGPSPFSDLRHVDPVSRVFGLDRGLPVDRWYIERFLEHHADDIRGVVLEFGDDRYTRRFGRPTQSDVLNVDPDLSHFAGIVPCGVKAHGVTSLADLGIVTSMADVDVALKRSFGKIFG